MICLFTLSCTFPDGEDELTNLNENKIQLDQLNTSGEVVLRSDTDLNTLVDVSLVSLETSQEIDIILEDKAESEYAE